MRMPVEPILYALNVGRGDSFFIEIPALEESYVILIDGGDCQKEMRVTPYAFIRERGWKRIDLMILTHLHPDHLYGLLEVSEHIPVTEALLPYPEMNLSIGELTNTKAIQTAELLRVYEELQMNLTRQQTSIVRRPPFGEKSVWAFGELILRHIEPVDPRDMAAYLTLEELREAPEDQQDRLLERFDGQSNADSSVLLLEHQDGTQLLLLSGDAVLSNWERILEREKLSPYVFKVGHHGVRDAWDEQLLAALSPDWVLVTNHKEEYEMFQDEWEGLVRTSGSQLFVTGAKDNSRCLISRLPRRPERIELE
ncbi:ComEC/Rec2 family competence protein [Paenibacillus dakarensis]|uniref:ComEC/Rec2 family competence protein n=1 Tax=Paenibacillus dakarensis TaxID=1527293 RepID=UPI0006D571EF|nr:MBL fold metallo-hydrolase [Paenibacillus dakarensis]